MIRVALAGAGKIARDQHAPALRANPSFQLIATADPFAQLDGVRSYPSLDALLENEPDIDAVAVCTPPQVRHHLATQALQRGCHVLLEKPPGRTTQEADALACLAAASNLTLFAAWHSQKAAGVDAARRWLATRRVRHVHISWKEDVRVWHPGQDWIWSNGGLGVFDPGINALSILTKLLEEPLRVVDASLAIPANRDMPVAATLSLSGDNGLSVDMELDFLSEGAAAWDIDVLTDNGKLRLRRGGSELFVDSKQLISAPDEEYPRLYARFAALIESGLSEVDTAPLKIVEDALRFGRRTGAPAFIW